MLIFNLQSLIQGYDTLNGTFKKTMRDTYPGDGLDPNKDSLTTLASFLGLPTRQEKFAPQSWQNLAKNFIGWQKDTSAIRLFFYFLLITPINLVMTPLKLLLNLAKLFTEVLPALVVILSYYLGVQGIKFLLSEIIDLWDRNDSKWIKIPLLSLYVLSIVVTSLSIALILGVSFQLQFFGRCLTSPIQHLQDMWTIGKVLGGQSNNGLPGRILPYFLVGITLILTTLLYAAVFPLAIKAISATVIPYFASHLPTAIITLINTISHAISPALAAIGRIILPVLTHVLPVGTLGLSSIITSMPEVVALGAFLGLSISTVGSGVSKFINYLSEKWHKPRPPFGTVILNKINDDDVGSDLDNDDVESNNISSGLHLLRTGPSSERLFVPFKQASDNAFVFTSSKPPGSPSSSSISSSTDSYAALTASPNTLFASANQNINVELLDEKEEDPRITASSQLDF